MFAINWTKLEFTQYLVIGGIALVVLAAGIYYFLPRIKLPVSVAAAVASLALGFGVGALTMAIWAYRPKFFVPMEFKTIPLPRVEQWLWGAGILAVLAIVFSFLPLSRLKLPTSAAATLGSLVLGFSVGLLMMTRLGYSWDRVPDPRGPRRPLQITPELIERVMGRNPSQTASLKAQLIALIEKLDHTTETFPLSLGAEQNKQVLAQLQELGEKEQMSEDDAKGQRDALLGILRVNERWLGTPTEAAEAAAKAANPFKTGRLQQHLKALQERLSH